MAEIKVSIVILTYNQLELTKKCIESIEKNTDVNYELVFVDNASSDGSPEFLETYCRDTEGYCAAKKLIKNNRNVGFAPGVNQGLDCCEGVYVCLLNNDTVVTNNWITDMIKCLERDEKAEIVGPVSAGTFFPQYVESINHMDGKISETSILYGFCEVFRRDLLFRIGCLDERYRIGNFEDHDFNERVIKLGGKLLIAGSVYVEHWCHKAWKSPLQLDYTTVKNKKKFEEKWGTVKEMDSTHKTQKYYECETGTVFIVENNQDYQNCIERIEDERIIEDEIVIVDSYSDGVELEGIIEKLTTTKRIIRVRVPQNHNLTKKELFKIGLNNSFAKKINMDKGK